MNEAKTSSSAEGLAGVHPSGATYAVQNVVLSVNVGTRLNLPQLASRAPNTEYEDKKGAGKKYFKCATLRIPQPFATATVYESGKIVVTGTKSLRDGRLAVQNICSVTEAAGFQVARDTVDATLVVVNIVVSCDAGFPINLHGLHREHHACATYAPEKFSGLTYRLPEPKVTIMVFNSGKFNLTGVKREEDISTILDIICPILAAFKLNPQSIPQRAAPAAARAKRRAAARPAPTAAAAGPAAAAAVAVAAAGPTSGPVGSSVGSSSSIQHGPSGTAGWQPQPGLNPLLPTQGQGSTQGLKRPRSAAEVLRAAASAGKLPPAAAARAAAGNRGLRLGEALPQAAQTNLMTEQPVMQPAAGQQTPLAGPAQAYPASLQQQQLGFFWATAAFQPSAVQQQQQLLGQLLQQRQLLERQRQQQQQFVQQSQQQPIVQQEQQPIAQQEQQHVQQEQQQHFLQPQPYPHQQFLPQQQHQQFLPQQQQQQQHPSAAYNQQAALADPDPPLDAPLESPSQDQEMPPATPTYDMPPPTPTWEMPHHDASPPHRFDA